MKKRCEKCGREFEARRPDFKICPRCHSSQKRSDVPSELLLKYYYDEDENFLREVFLSIPEDLAKIFAKDGLAAKQLRDFYQVILRARNKALLQGISVARPILFECQRNAAYQLKRGVIPQSFNHFLKHHLALAEKDEKSLDGFCQHLESIVAYFPKEKGGLK